MGLCDEERLTKMTWAVRGLSKLGHQLRDHPELEGHGLSMAYRENVSRLVNLLDGLWHQYLGSKTNGIFWLLGGDFNNPIEHTGSPWSSALMLHFAQSKPDLLEKADDYFDPFDPFDKFLDLKNLLPGQLRGLLYEVQAWTEQLSYALRRYDDSLLGCYPELNKSISDIQGVLFEMFQTDNYFGRAYLAHRLLQWVYEDQELRPVFKELYWHCQLSRAAQHEMALLIEWDAWRLQVQDTQQNRVILAMRMMGKHYNNGFQDRNLEQLFKLTEGMGLSKKKLRKEAAKCQALKDEAAATQKAGAKTDYGPFSEFRERKAMDEAYPIHGFGAHEWISQKFAKGRKLAAKVAKRVSKK